MAILTHINHNKMMIQVKRKIFYSIVVMFRLYLIISLCHVHQINAMELRYNLLESDEL